LEQTLLTNEPKGLPHLAPCAQVVWHGYIKTMTAVGMDNGTRLYVASGMLTYGASVDMDRTIGYLQHMGVCSEVHHKERYIPQEELEGGRVWCARASVCLGRGRECWRGERR
jgi:hypothetical protein